MELRLSQNQELRQVQRLIPEQIIAAEILQLSLLDVEKRLQEEMEKNPALALSETNICPSCRRPIKKEPCPYCEFNPYAYSHPDTNWNAKRSRGARFGDEFIEAYDFVAGERTLNDDLHEQWDMASSEEDRMVGAFIIDSLDDQGYLREPLFDIGDRFKRSVPQTEVILKRVQELEPAGVAARDLRECLALQAERLGSSTATARNVLKILDEHWSDFSNHHYERITEAGKISKVEIQQAQQWIRDYLTPHPCETFRPDWERFAPRKERISVPDAIIGMQSGVFVVDILDGAGSKLKIDSDCLRLRNYAKGRRTVQKEETDFLNRVIKEADILIHAVEQRRRTLHFVLTAIVEEQTDFLMKGPDFLKPLSQKRIAEKLDIHESTVCRALSNKRVEIPNGEVIPVTVFFDSALPAKEKIQDLILREKPDRPLSDAKIVELLSMSGISIARRTVTKYRESLKIPSSDLRKRLRE